MSWARLAEDRPDLASAGRALLYQFGVGLAFLATVRADGGPRLHPVCPLLVGDRLVVFVIPSLKRGDLERDGRYSLHSFPAPDNEDAFSVTGRARLVDGDTGLRSAAAAQFLAERAHVDLGPDPLAEQSLFELDLDGCLLTRTTGHGDPSPRHAVWRA